MNTGLVVLGIRLTCGVCGLEKTMDNPLSLSLGMLRYKAEGDDVGWYVPDDGLTLCPKHQREAAAKYNLPSLFAARPRVTLPTPQTAAKSKAVSPGTQETGGTVPIHDQKTLFKS